MVQRTVTNLPSFSEAANAQQSEVRPNIQPGIQNFLAAQQITDARNHQSLADKLAQAQSNIEQLKLDPKLAQMKANTGLVQAQTELASRKAPELPKAGLKGLLDESVYAGLPSMLPQETFNAMYKVAELKASKESKAAEKGLKLTPAQETVDKEFAKDYNDYVTQGGVAGVKANFDKLDASLTALKAMQESGAGLQRASGMLPDSVRGFVAPDYTRIEQDTRANVLGLLRQTLGPQFTETEGERIFKQTFDPTLPVEMNVDRLTKLRDSLQATASAKASAIEYYNQKGTLAGYQTTPPSFGGATSNPETDAKKAALKAKLGI